jgi:hypothetical protein
MKPQQEVYASDGEDFKRLSIMRYYSEALFVDPRCTDGYVFFQLPLTINRI